MGDEETAEGVLWVEFVGGLGGMEELPAVWVGTEAGGEEGGREEGGEGVTVEGGEGVAVEGREGIAVEIEGVAAEEGGIEEEGVAVEGGEPVEAVGVTMLVVAETLPAVEDELVSLVDSSLLTEFTSVAVGIGVFSLTAAPSPDTDNIVIHWSSFGVEDAGVEGTDTKLEPKPPGEALTTPSSPFVDTVEVLRHSATKNPTMSLFPSTITQLLSTSI